MKTILVSLDFSEVTRSVLATAVDLAQACNARLVLFHAARQPASLLSCQMAGVDVTQAAADYDVDAAVRLDALAADIPGSTAITQRRAGIPAQEILHAAHDNGADLIVMGSHGHGAFHDLLLGSTTRGVMKHAACPVLVVPAGLVKSAGENAPERTNLLALAVD